MILICSGTARPAETVDIPLVEALCRCYGSSAVFLVRPSEFVNMEPSFLPVDVHHGMVSDERGDKVWCSC